MKSNVFTYCIIVVVTILITKGVLEENSSPVEEMYHRQLVTTIDSILDARSYKEVVDSDDVTVPHDQFGRVILPSEYK